MTERLEVGVTEGVKNATLPKKLKVVHQEMIAEMVLLFYIAEKVRQVRHPMSCLKLGHVFMSKNLLDDAVTFFQMAAELDPTSAEVYCQLGFANIRRGDFANAEMVLPAQIVDQTVNMVYRLEKLNDISKLMTMVGKNKGGQS